MTTAPAVQPMGVYAAAITPLDGELRPNVGALIGHCRWLLANGCDGLAPFGTTGEGTSLPVDQKLELFEVLAGSGLPLDRMIPGTGTAALADTVKLTAAAVRLGYAGALALPAF